MTISDEILDHNYQGVERAIQKGESVNGIDIYGFNPLSEAAIANDLEIAKLLIEHGADIKAPDVMGGTALNWAVENHNMELCRLLLEKGADPNGYARNAQPLLLQPILRRQNDLKELLYEYGADLKFAQDYITTKLLGHRFELVGKVDIVDHSGKFIEMSFEGFILEFTLSIIRESLAQFKNNFAARNLRPHFPDLKLIIAIFDLAMELVSYQQHLVDIDRYKQRLEMIAKAPLLLLPIGYEGHAITFIKCGQFFAKCDRGANSLHHPSVEIFQMGNPAAFNARFLKAFVYRRQDSYSVGEGVIQALELTPVTAIHLPSQLTGNCSWANVEASIPAMLLMLWMQNNLNADPSELSRYREVALAIYKQWLEWDKDRALHEYVKSFHDASPARKASKAAVLAAVLAQTCRYTNPQDVDHADKIFSVLAAPEYKYVLKSYLKVYKRTEVAHNLLELIDLYSHR